MSEILEEEHVIISDCLAGLPHLTALLAFDKGNFFDWEIHVPAIFSYPIYGG